MANQESRLDFNRIAKGYDRFNHLTSLGIDKIWRWKAVRMMCPAERVLDVAVGTGDLALEMLKRHKAQQVVGIDLSEGMMQIGREKAAKKGYSEQVVFEMASALELPYPDASFDAVTCAYGIRNFSDPDQGLREMQRVLRPGGQLIILEFSLPRNQFIRFFYDLYFNQVMTRIGSLITHDRSAFRYFYQSVKHFIWGEEMLQHLRDAGFADPKYRLQTFGISTHYTATKR